MTLIAGPCVIEDEALVFEVAAELKKQLESLPVDFYFKASFDKANRSSIDGFRGPGMELGLKILEKVKAEFGFKLLTDIHLPEQALPVAQVVDFVQVPAFLCRQTDLIVATTEACLQYDRKLNIKKGQFLAPQDTKNIVDKVRAVRKKHSLVSEKYEGKNFELMLTERGTTFGYQNLIVDMTSFQMMKSFGVSTIFDATHSVQMPGGGADGKSTGGKRENIEILTRAAFAAGADGLFMECHPRPEVAKSDGPNAFPLQKVGQLVQYALEFRKLSSELPKIL